MNLKTLYKLYIALATQSSKIKYIFFLFVKSRAITLIKKKNIGVYNLEFKTQRNLKAKQTPIQTRSLGQNKASSFLEKYKHQQKIIVDTQFCIKNHGYCLEEKASLKPTNHTTH